MSNISQQLPPAFQMSEGTGGVLAWLNAPQRRGPLLVAPALITLFVVNIFPLLWSFGLSFFDYRANRMRRPEFVGLENYIDIIRDPDVWERFMTTGAIVAASVGLQLLIGFGLAMLFANKFPLRRVLLMLVLTPMMLSFVSVAIFFKLFYDPTLGLLPWFYSFFSSDVLTLLATPFGATLGIVIADAWMWSPFVMLLVLAGLVSVPQHLYEAAEIDRASPWRRFRTITFPYVKSLLLLALLFRTIETFKTFDLVFLITAGGPGSSTETIAVYAYRQGFQNFRTSEASALAYIILFVVIVLTSIYLYIVNNRAEEAEQ